MSWFFKLINKLDTAPYYADALAEFNRQNGTEYKRWQDLSRDDLEWHLARYVMLRCSETSVDVEKE
jgi:hypothetical protein